MNTQTNNTDDLKLFKPGHIGSIEVKNRVVMAPLTRCRSDEAAGDIPGSEMNIEYYRQRANAGLIISEGTQVSPAGKGYMATPGIYSDAQVEGWKLITNTVHEAGGKIIAQIWHVGRITHPELTGGLSPIAPSAVKPNVVAYTHNGKVDVPVPHELTAEEIKVVVNQYRQGAANAIKAGFDGVEIHGANGYLLDQFLQDSSNHRTDEYGGPVENRARLMLEVTDAVTGVWGADRVGMHLAPRGDAHGVGDSDPAATFGYVARELGRRKLAFLCAREHHGAPALGPQLRREFGGPFIANEGFSKASADEALAAGQADAVAWGRLFIANPDLPRRFQLNAVLNEPQPETFYGQGPVGYIDYPSLSAA